jgi:hypothetical protein
VTTEKAVEIGADLVALTLTESVALSASGLEKVGTLLCVTCLQLANIYLLQFEYLKRQEKEVKRPTSNEGQDIVDH